MLRFVIISALIISGLSIILPDDFISDLMQGPSYILAETKHDMLNIYRKDFEIDEDMQKAIRVQMRNAKDGNTDAQYMVGLVFYKGSNGIIKDYSKAAKYISLAAEQGHANAQNALGVMYYKGEGVSKDIVSAYKWVNLSAIQGNEKAIKAQKIILKQMDKSQLIKAKKMSDEWHRKQ